MKHIKVKDVLVDRDGYVATFSYIIDTSTNKAHFLGWDGTMDYKEAYANFYLHIKEVHPTVKIEEKCNVAG